MGEVGAFLDRQQKTEQISITLRILVLRLATYSTCNPAPAQSERVRARKAPASATFAAAASAAAPAFVAAFAAAAARTCITFSIMVLPRAEVRDPPVSTAGVIHSPCSARSSSLSLEVMISTFAVK